MRATVTGWVAALFTGGFIGLFITALDAPRWAAVGVAAIAILVVWLRAEPWTIRP